MALCHEFGHIGYCDLVNRLRAGRFPRLLQLGYVPDIVRAGVVGSHCPQPAYIGIDLGGARSGGSHYNVKSSEGTERERAHGDRSLSPRGGDRVGFIGAGNWQHRW